MMNQANPLISVIIPTRNRPQLVRRAVSTALNQTLKAIEVIIVVDGPDDATIQVLRQVGDDRCMFLRYPKVAELVRRAMQELKLREASGWPCWMMTTNGFRKNSNCN